MMKPSFAILFWTLCSLQGGAMSSETSSLRTGTKKAASVDGLSYYLNQSGGAASGNGLSPEAAFVTADEALSALAPGDTLYIMGELTNDSYDETYSFTSVEDPHLWHGENTLSIRDLHGTAEKPITITSYATNPAVLKGDGANIVRITLSSYLTIKDLEVYGEVERIPLSTAKAVQMVYRLEEGGPIQYRVPIGSTDEEIMEMELPLLGSNIPRVSYTDTRGMYISHSQHLIIQNNKVHHVPGNGLRVAWSEFVAVVGNEVHDTSRKSYSGTHGLVVTHTLDNLPADDYLHHLFPRSSLLVEEDYRAIVVGNSVHSNYNEIYSWVGTKPFIHARIDEGKGISLQRNNDFMDGSTSRILVANNIAYWNGFSGVHSQDGDNVDFFGNMAYMNSYTNSVYYAPSGDQRGKNIGISMQGGTGCRIANNIAVIDTDWNAFPISITGKDYFISDNIVYGYSYSQKIMKSPKRDKDEIAISTNTIVADPLLDMDIAHGYDVLNGSPAIRAGNPAYMMAVDYNSSPRDPSLPTIGAIEYSA